MTYKQIEAAREVRLWVGQIVVPALMFATTSLCIPEVRKTIAKGVNNVKKRIHNSKEESA